MKHMSLIKGLLTLLMIVLLSSCNSNLKPESQGKKMTTFFNNNNNNNKSLPKLHHRQDNARLITEQSPQPRISQGFIRNQATTQSLQPALSADFIRTQATELDNSFPRLANPRLNMFIYPHLTKDGNPVPGYTTNFKLYKLDHYALPSEAL